MTQAAEQQAARKRYSFGPVWSKNVVAGNVKDHDKLVAHGVKLKVGTKSALSKITLETLIARVGEAIKKEAAEAEKTPKSKKAEGGAEQAAA